MVEGLKFSKEKGPHSALAALKTPDPCLVLVNKASDTPVQYHIQEFYLNTAACDLLMNNHPDWKDSPEEMIRDITILMSEEASGRLVLINCITPSPEGKPYQTFEFIFDKHATQEELSDSESAFLGFFGPTLSTL